MAGPKLEPLVLTERERAALGALTPEKDGVTGAGGAG